MYALLEDQNRMHIDELRAQADHWRRASVVRRSRLHGIAAAIRSLRPTGRARHAKSAVSSPAPAAR